MHFARIAAGLCLLFVTACAAPAETRDLRAALDAQLAENAEAHGIPAQAVLVLRNGDTLYRGQTGFADVETQRAVRADDVYAVYSVSKLFVSTLILELVDQGRVALDAPASRYVELPAAWHEVRIDQLLSHASGLPDFFTGEETTFPATRSDVFRVLGGQPMQFRPGTETRYTQTNYLVLQAVLEATYGAPYREIVRTRITEPLGMRNTYLGLSSAPGERLVTAYRGENGALVRDRMIPWRDYSIAHAELFTTPGGSWRLSHRGGARAVCAAADAVAGVAAVSIGKWAERSASRRGGTMARLMAIAKLATTAASKCACGCSGAAMI